MSTAVGTDDGMVEVRAAASEPRRSVRVALTAIVVVPILTAAIRAIRDDWFPIGDNALLFIRTRDVWTEHHPLLGSWTSASLSVGEHMNNPGAMYDWLIAPYAHVLSPGPAAAVGVATVNIALVVGVSAVTHRIGGWSLQRWVLLGTAVLLWSLGSELLIDIWQANAMVLVFFALLWISVGIAGGDDWLLPWAAVVVSLLLQTHLSTAYIFGVVAVATVATRIWFQAARRAEQAATQPAGPGWRRVLSMASPDGRPVVISAVVLAVLWAPSFFEQLFGEGEGNLSRLLTNASGGDVVLGLGNAARIIGSIAALPPWWGRHGYDTTVPVTGVDADGRLLEIAGLAPAWIAVTGLCVVIGVLFALTGRMRSLARRPQAVAGAIALIVLIGSVPALGRLTIGPVGLSPHHVRWVWPMVAFVHIAIVWLAVTAWQHRASRPPSGSTTEPAERPLVIPIVAAIVIVALLSLPFHVQQSGPNKDYATLDTMRRIRPELARVEGFGPVLYDVSNVRIFEPYSTTMMMWLQERGVEFRVDSEAMVRQLGPARRADGTEGTRLYQLEGVEALTSRGPACLIGVASALGESTEAEIAARVRQHAIDRADGDGVDLAASIDEILAGESAVDGEAFSPDDRALVETWVTTSYALFADGEAC